MSNQEIVQSFLQHVMSNNKEAFMAMVSHDAQFVNTPREVDGIDIYGIHRGPEGACKFFQTFLHTMEPGEFNVTAMISEGEHVAMYGNLNHTMRKTGRQYKSDWAIVFRIINGKIAFYHIYEDTGALERALANE